MKTEDFICGLESDDFFVRSTSLSILQHLPDPPIEATYAAYRSCEKYGAREAFEYPHQMCQLPLDEAMFEKVLRQAKADPQKLVEEKMVLHIFPWLTDAPVDLLEKYLDELREFPAETLDSAYKDYVAHIVSISDFKIALSSVSGGELFGHLDEIFLRCRESEYFPQREVKSLDYYADSIANDFDALPDDQIIEWLRDPEVSESNPAAPWKAGFAILVATRRKLEIATPYILELIDLDWDWYSKLISEFVKCTGGESGLRSILENFDAYDNNCSQLYLSGAIEHSPTYPGLENLLIEVLESIDDVYTESHLACYLAKLGSPGGKGAALEIYNKYEGHPEVEVIPEFLLTVYSIQGDNPGNTEKFRKIVEAQAEARRKEQENSPFSMLEKSPVQQKPKDNSTFKVTNIEPEPIVGRNRPCPCGSGKKHKMCCMRKAG